MTECSQIYCTLDKGQFRLNNNKWGQANAAQSIFVNDDIIGWSWNNPGGGYNYPEVIVGTNFGQWKSTSPYFPIQYKYVKTWNADITYKYTQKPTGSWWNLAFDIYWMDSKYKTKFYNIMIWFNGNAKISDPYVKDVDDGYNIYKYYHGNRSWPWDCFILKNQLSDPVVGVTYTYKVNIKKLIDAINNDQFTNSGDWFIPDIQLGNENENGAGRIEISAYNIELNGNWIRLNQPVAKYRCTGTPNYQCVEDPNGPYNSLAECQAACKVPVTKYRCTGAPDYQCVEDPNGPYESLDACLAVCKPLEKKFKVNVIGSQGVLVMKSTRGDHTADEACKLACNIIGDIKAEEENDIINIRTIIELMDLYDDTLDIKPNILRNKIQEKIQHMIAELSEGKTIEFTAV